MVVGALNLDLAVKTGNTAHIHAKPCSIAGNLVFFIDRESIGVDFARCRGSGRNHGEQHVKFNSVFPRKVEICSDSLAIRRCNTHGEAHIARRINQEQHRLTILANQFTLLKDIGVVTVAVEVGVLVVVVQTAIHVARFVIIRKNVLGTCRSGGHQVTGIKRIGIVHREVHVFKAGHAELVNQGARTILVKGILVQHRGTTAVHRTRSHFAPELLVVLQVHHLKRTFDIGHIDLCKRFYVEGHAAFISQVLRIFLILRLFNYTNVNKRGIPIAMFNTRRVNLVVVFFE